MKKALLWAISILLLSQSPSHASDTRVDSTGDLSLVITDESVAVNPFTLGNPAGLALLTPQTRFDAAAEWAKDASPSDGLFHIYGSMSQFNDDVTKYHGLIAFLNPNWALQADGDTLHTEGQNDSGDHIATNDRTRELGRMAYNFGIFTLGAEIQPEQTNLTISPYQFNVNNQITSGSGTNNNLEGTGGLLINLLGASNPNQDHLRIGGIAGTQLGQFDEIKNLQAFNSLLSTNFTVTQTITTNNLLLWGPEIYFDSPGKFEAGLTGRFVTWNLGFHQDSTDATSIPNVANFNLGNENISEGTAVFKMTSPLSTGINLKTGGDFTIENQTENTFDSTENPNGGFNVTGWTGILGLGVEAPQDFTLGVQAALSGVTGTQSNSSAVTANNNYFDYKISIGGERNLSKSWAFRMGVIVEDQNNTGTVDEDDFYFPVHPGQEIISTTILAGIGYQDKNLSLDLGVSWDQPSVVNDPSAYGDLYRTHIAASYRFN